MRIYDVQVNHLENPIGFRMERVTFSWKVKDARGMCQQSARAVVAQDPAMTGVLLDTGFDKAADSLCFPVELELNPRTRYYYQIHVRSDAGEEASSEVCFFETGKREEPWRAQWISCCNSEKRLPIFEKEICAGADLVKARLYICGLGVYEAYVDGQRIGNEYFAPYCNNYNQWVQYQTYDVTHMLTGSCRLSVHLGGGWYCAPFSLRTFENGGYYGDSWKLLAELRLTYADGREEVVGTDDTWSVRRSNLTFSTIYDGEHRDDTLPTLPVERAALCEAPTGALTERMSTPVTIHETITPVELIHTPKGELVLDMGQEFTGIFRLKIDVPRGQIVHIQTGEILQEGCFYNANLRSAKSEYFYVSSGEPVVLEPHFTFFGYRYVKIEGIPQLKCEDFLGLTLYSHIPERGSMRTGHALLNQLLSNIRWGMKGNFLDVPTDCPQRDERMGWTGDAQVFSPTATYLHDTYSFYAKYLHDLYQEQIEYGGQVPNIIPSFGDVGSTCAWSDASCIIPWNVYCFYGDKSILVDQLPSMKAWVDYVTRLDGDDHNWRRQFHFGDWLALDNMNGNAEEVMGATDVGFLANLHYAASAELVSKAAAVLGDWETERTYAALAQREYQAVKDEYFSVTGRPCVNTQTGLLLALKYNLSPNRTLVIEQLKKLFEKTGNKLQTGFIGTPILCKVLSENGMEELAWKLLLNEEYPGWLREVKLGATTVWERWNSVLDDGRISGISMNSLNHYAYGSIGEWMFRRIAGFDVSEEYPGCRHMDMKPLLNWALREQETVFDSPSGEYRSFWRILDAHHVELRVTVPFGCSATLTLPDAREKMTVELKPGTHTFCYETDRDMRPGFTMHSTLRELEEEPGLWEALCAQLPLNMIPQQYYDCALSELEGKFGDHVAPEMLQKAKSILEAYRL